MKGRRYRLASPPVGTQSTSVRTRASIEPRNASSGSSGSARRRAERANRVALASGRNPHTLPSSCR